MAKKGLPEINASSLADIAFLLLTFFLIATSMDRREGVEAKIKDPRITDQQPPVKKLPRNVLDIQLGLVKTEVLVEGERQQPKYIKDLAKKHIMNNGVDPNYAETPEKALFMIRSLKATPFDVYLSVKNQVDAAYHEIWDQVSRQQYNMSYEQLEKLSKSDDAAEAQDAANKIKEINGVNGKYKIRIGEAKPEGQ